MLPPELALEPGIVLSNPLRPANGLSGEPELPDAATAAEPPMVIAATDAAINNDFITSTSTLSRRSNHARRRGWRGCLGNARSSTTIPRAQCVDNSIRKRLASRENRTRLASRGESGGDDEALRPLALAGDLSRAHRAVSPRHLT